jgi:hypothetical protein
VRERRARKEHLFEAVDESGSDADAARGRVASGGAPLHFRARVRVRVRFRVRVRVRASEEPRRFAFELFVSRRDRKRGGTRHQSDDVM